jgi:hypothetical protein
MGRRLEGFWEKTSGDVRVDPEVQQNPSSDDALELGKHLRPGTIPVVPTRREASIMAVGSDGIIWPR